jgi:hypothetical protein
MKIFLSIVLVLSCSLFVFGQETKKSSVEDLGWISGCWQKKGKTEGSFTSEHWTKPAGMMLAVARTVKQGRVSAFEYLRIIEKDSDIYYVAKPSSAKTETAFKLTSLKGKRAVFENPAHDFPTRIIYSLVNEKTLAVRVEADKNGRPSGFGYSLKKIDCN